jgi:hypothetical protein
MWFEIARRLFVIVLSVALATGLVVRSVPTMDIAAPAATAAATADPGMPMSGKCDGCAGDEKAMAAACSAVCNGAVAVLPVLVAFGPAAVEAIGPSAVPAATGHAFPPDPYPPRPIVLN